MPGYVVTAVFEVGGGKVPTGRDVLAAHWGPGHRFSYCDGNTLTLVAEVVSPRVADAFETVLSRAEQRWQGRTGHQLPAPSILRMQTSVPPEIKVAAGAVGRGPDGLIAESAAQLAGRLRATRAALADLERRMPWPGRDGGPTAWPGDDDPDDGGLAGVREPRRPGPGPAPVGEVLEEPRSLPEIERLLPQRP
jgi:hypothetical protein